MSLLQKIQSGKQSKPPRLVIYGTPGIGKSTFAAGAPNPVFIQTEDGLDEIDCNRFPLAERLEDVMGALSELAREEHGFETVVIDSLDWLERLIFARVCSDFGVSNIEKADGGYARGYTHALDRWREVLAALDRLRNQRGMVVIGIAHAKVEKFEDPEAPPYDRYSPRMHKHATALVTEWSDAVLFATRKVRVKTEDTGFNRKRSIASAVGKDGGERIIRTTGGPACIAKNRYGMVEELDLSWASFVNAMARTQQEQE